MPKLNLFYKYYDALFKSKNYALEIETVLKMGVEFGKQPIRRVLEIGCGTGNHTLELAKAVEQVVALDTDKDMVLLAQEKVQKVGAKNIEILHSPIERLSHLAEFDLALALFNVVTYIPDVQALESFLKSVRRCLKKGGGFIFDCWNGTAALKDPPANKTIKQSLGAQTIICDIVPQTDLKNKITTLTYSLKVLNPAGELIATDQFSFEQTLFAPQDLHTHLKPFFKVLHVCPPFEPRQNATDDNWKIMFICEAC